MPCCTEDDVRSRNPNPNPRSQHTRLELHKAYRIQNDQFWDAYAHHRDLVGGPRETYIQPLTHTDSRSQWMQSHQLNYNANECYLWQATKPEHIDAMCSEGLSEPQFDFSGPFGAGAYFSEHISNSDLHCVPDKEGTHYVFLSRVVMGNFIEVTRTPETAFTKPRTPKGVRNDSLVGQMDGDDPPYREFVAYSCWQAYPEFLLEYKRTMTPIPDPLSAVEDPLTGPSTHASNNNKRAFNPHNKDPTTAELQAYSSKKPPSYWTPNENGKFPAQEDGEFRKLQIHDPTMLNRFQTLMDATFCRRAGRSPDESTRLTYGHPSESPTSGGQLALSSPPSQVKLKPNNANNAGSTPPTLAYINNNAVPHRLTVGMQQSLFSSGMLGLRRVDNGDMVFPGDDGTITLHPGVHYSMAARQDQWV